MSSAVKQIAIKAALESGRFIKSSVGKAVKIEHKGRINIVTEIDKRSEDMIIKALKASFPGYSILSEERAPEERGSPFKWIIDPIDGTTNFAHGFPFFAVSIALEESGNVILGVVYDPMRDELFVAEKGKGSWLNGKQIHVSGNKELSDSLLATGFAYGIQGAENTNVKNFENFLMRAQAIRRPGSAALDLSYIACGRFDGFWEMDLKPWDSAAAMLLVKEAKGVVTKFDGSAYTPYDTEVLASNGHIHKQMIAVLK